jgi:hypothetical protein
MLVFLALHVDAECARVHPGVAPRRSGQRRHPPRIRPAASAEGAGTGRQPAGALGAVIVLVAAVFVPLKRSFDALSREIAQRHELNDVQREASAVWQERFAAGAGGEARSLIDVLEAKRDDVSDGLTMRAFTSRALSPRNGRHSHARTAA